MACATRRGTIASPMTMAPGRSATSGAQSRGRRSPTTMTASASTRSPAPPPAGRSATEPSPTPASEVSGRMSSRTPVEPREKLGAALGRDAHREGHAGSHQRDPLDPRGDAQLHGADGGPPSESVVHDDEVRRAAQPLGARGQSLGGRRGEAGVARHRQHLFGAARDDDRVAPLQILGGGLHSDAQRHPAPPATLRGSSRATTASRGAAGPPRPRPARRRRPSRAPRRRPRSPRLWRA